jgi:hypothetical protein
MGSFIRIGPGIEEGEPSSCGGVPRGVVVGGHKILSPPRRGTQIPKLTKDTTSNNWSHILVLLLALEILSSTGVPRYCILGYYIAKKLIFRKNYDFRVRTSQLGRKF